MSDSAYVSVLKAALESANKSWTATDALYGSLCAAAIGAGSWLISGSPTAGMGLLVLAFLIVGLCFSWVVLIVRYRSKIKGLLRRLLDASESAELASYYQETLSSFEADRKDFIAPAIPLCVLGLSVLFLFLVRQ